MFRSLNLSVFKNPYSLGAPVLALTAVSSYSIYKDSNFVSPSENISLARIRFDKYKDKQIRQEKIDLSDLSDLSKVKKYIEEDRTRLNNFYRKYNSEDLSVNVDEISSTSSLDFFVQIKSKEEPKNLNNLWLDNIHLNQLSIDRYGPEYKEDGTRQGSEKKVHKIVDWFDIDLSSFSYDQYDHISFNFFNKDINKKEVEILMNEKSKYQPDLNESNDWLIWLDKNLLSLKMNYALTTYVFDKAKTVTKVASILNDTNKKTKIEKNFESLPEEYKSFADNYVSIFLNNQPASNQWESIVTKVVSTTPHIKSDDLNLIFNKFKSSQKPLGIFNQHLISRISSGDTGNWKIALNLDKDASNKEQPKDIKKISNDSNDGRENEIKIFVDADINPSLKLRDLHDVVKNYSVKNLDLKIDSLASEYSESDQKSNESLHVLSINKDNEFGFYSKNHLLPMIFFLLFIGSIMAYLLKIYKVPGVIFASGISFGIVYVLSSFFALGSSLSLIGISALFIGIFYALFLSFYLLGFLKKLFDFEFLDKRNIWILLKRGLVMSVDISLPLFVFSTFIAFFSPLYLREFGIILSLCILFFFPIITLFCSLLVIRYVSDNFFYLKSKYSKSVEKSDSFFCSLCDRSFNNKFCLQISLFFVLICLISFFLFTNFGFNSFSFLKNNFLLAFSSDSSSVNTGQSAPTRDEISKLGSVLTLLPKESLQSYLINTDNVEPIKTLINSKIKNGNYYVQSIDSFKDIADLKDLFVSLGFINLFVSLYVLFRFKFRNFLIYLTNIIISFLSFLAFLLISRISIFSNIFIAICTFFSVFIMYHSVLFHIDKNNSMDWFLTISKGFLSIIYRKLSLVIFLFLAFSLFTLSEEVIFLNIYVFLSMIFVHFLATAFYAVLNDRFKFLTSNYLLRKDLSVKEDLEEDFNNLDSYDEEIIIGINKLV